MQAAKERKRACVKIKINAMSAVREERGRALIDNNNNNTVQCKCTYVLFKIYKMLY